MSKAIINFATINKDALEMVSNCQLAVNALAQDEQALKKERERLKDAGKNADEIKDLTINERQAVKASKERAQGMCEVFIIRNISTEDAVAGDIYHFDFEAFLRNIGVLTGDEVDKKALKKLEIFRDMVVDRTQYYVARRKKGEDKLTARESKDIKNNPIELVLGIVSAMVNSGAIEYCGGGLAVKEFNK